MAIYLVTGVAGFIGAAVAKALLERGDTVVGVDNLSTGFENNIPKGAEFFLSDTQNQDLYEKLPSYKYDAIFHIAGQSSGEISFDDPVYDLRTNTESTLHLLKFCLKVGCHRMIYAGTMSVYGVQPDFPVKENAILKPESFYGVGKIASEQYLRIYQNYGIDYTTLRLFNVYGPGQNMLNMRQGMVSIFMTMMLKNNSIQVKGSPDRYRDFVYIDDVVNAFLLCLNKESSYNKDINIGGSGRVTVGELIQGLVELHSEPVSVEYKGSTLGDLHGIYPDLSFAYKCLGYIPHFDLPTGLKLMYDWAKKSVVR